VVRTAKEEKNLEAAAAEAAAFFIEPVSCHRIVIVIMIIEPVLPTAGFTRKTGSTRSAHLKYVASVGASVAVLVVTDVLMETGSICL